MVRHSQRKTLPFLSTPSARRATETYMDAAPPSEISIHALREEGDNPSCKHQHFVDQFLSTPSARRATTYHTEVNQQHEISIHALREEGDRGPC